MAARAPRNWSLARRLLLHVLLLLTLVWALAMGGIYWHTRQHVEDLLDDHLQHTAVLLAHQSLDDIDEHELEKLDKDARHGRKREARPSPAVYQIWKEGELLVRSPQAPKQALASGERGFSDIRLDGRNWRVYTAQSRDGELQVMVGEDQRMRNDIVLGNIRSLLLALLAAYPVVALLVWLSVRRALRPVRQAGELIRQRPPQAHTALTLPGAPQEIQPLLDALNQLFVRIGELLHSERRFTADAAHELRTPIAAIRMMAQVAQGATDAAEREQALLGVIQGCDRATRLVEQLLQLARLEADADTDASTVDLMPALQQVVADLEHTHAAARGQTVHLQAPAQLHAAMAPALAGVLLRNLLDNALRYSPDGARVQLQLQTLVPHGMQWTVEDSGPGMQEADMQRLGERFFRVLGTGRPGSGLGWSIVRRIAALYGLQLVVDRSPALGGLRIRVTGPGSGSQD